MPRGHWRRWLASCWTPFLFRARQTSRPLLLELEARLAPAATLSVGDATFNLAAGAGAFSVTRTGDLTPQVTVGYTVADGTALGGANYTAPATGTVTFASGQATASLPLTVLGNNFAEASQTLSVQLTGVVDVVGPPPSFAPQQGFATGGRPFSVSSADVNGDGWPDLLLTNYGSASVSVLLNTMAPGASTPFFTTQQPFATGSGPFAVSSADVNGDGRPDLLVANSSSASLSVLLNTTAPGSAIPAFAPQQTFATGSRPRSVATADVNGDGQPDLLVANFDSSSVSVLRNTTAPGASTPSFAPQQTFATGLNPVTVSSADVNGDGQPDLLVANGSSSSVSVLLNTTAPGASTPSFTPQQPFATGFNPFSVSSADVNGDGKPDLLAANYSSASVSVLLNTTAPGAATPSFATLQTFATESKPYAVSSADVNGDGKPDLLVANFGSASVSVLLNTTVPGSTAPAFAPQRTFATVSGPVSVSSGDVNGDGQPDLLVAGFNAGSVSVLLNTTQAPVTPAAALSATFSQGATPATGANPFSVSSADVNGDGKPDLLAANYNDASVSVLLNTTVAGSSTPSFAAQLTFATGTRPISVSSADVNGDGKPDLLVANSSSDSVSVLLNTTTTGSAIPTFALQQTFATGARPRSVASADVNGDGRPDLLVANFNGNNVSVLLNTTAPGSTVPSFAAQRTFLTGVNPISVSSADLNGDGQPDLLVANGSSSSVAVLLNTTVTGATTPSFATRMTFATGFNPFSVASADVNGDGKPDLLAANYSSASVSVLLNTTAPGASTPSFATQQTFATDSTPYAVSSADVNGDGRPDLLVVNYRAASVSVLLNTTAPGAATPTFAAQQTFPTGSRPFSVASADVNGDGKADILVANFGSSSVSVLLNTTPAPAPPPVGPSPTFSQVTTPATGLNPSAVSSADVNGDGKPDLLVTNLTSARVSVLLNTTAPGANPSFAPQQAFATGRSPVSVSSRDVNGDGQPDLLVANRDSDSVSVLLNTTAPGASTPSFATQQTFATGGAPTSLSSRDVNGDGKADLIVSNRDSDSVSVLLNTTAPGASTPSFAPQQTFATGSRPYSVSSADVNGDGRPDLLVANFFSDSVSVLLNTTAPGASTPSFASQRTFLTGSNPISVASADVNGDGKPDLLVANLGSDNVSVLLNTTAPGATTPSFTAPQPFATGSRPVSVSSADVNGDGRPDLLVTNSSSDSVSVLLNATAPGATIPAFAPQQTFATGSNPFSVAVADVNGDGQPDLLAANFSSDSVSVLLNRPAVVGQATATVTLDGAPVVVSLVRADGAVTSAGLVRFTVTFSEAVSGLTAGHFTLTGSATAGAAVGAPTTGDGGVTWTVPVTAGGEGTLGLDLTDRTGLTDAAGNKLYQSRGDDGTSFTGVAGPLYTIDRTAPAVSVGAPSAALTAGGPVTFTVTYGDANFGSSALSAANVRLVSTGTATGTLSFDAGSGATSTVTVSGITGDGTLALTIDAGSATDQAGNQSAAASSQTFVVDNTAPTVSVSAPSAAFTAGGPVTFTVTYTDANFGSSTLSSANVRLVSTGTATGTLSFDAGAGATRTVTVSGISGDGTLALSIDAGSATDQAGNGAPAASSPALGVANAPPPPPDVTSPPAVLTLTGRVLVDANSSGGPDPGEVGLAGQTVFADLDGDGGVDPGEPAVISAADGTFALPGVAPGVVVRLAFAPGTLAPTALADGFTVPSAGPPAAGVDFPVVPLSPVLAAFPGPGLFAPGGADATEDYVRALYRAILGREADGTVVAADGSVVPEFQVWIDRLGGALDVEAARIAVVVGIWESPEHRRLQVQEYYRNFLGRDAAADSLAGVWVGLLLGGAPEQTVVQGILDSPEYLGRFADNPGLVAGLFAGLGIPADGTTLTLPGGPLDLLARLDAGGVAPATPASIALVSAEVNSRIAASAYLAYLQRVGSPDEIAYYALQLIRPVGSAVEDLGVYFLASQEFLTLTRASRP